MIVGAISFGCLIVSLAGAGALRSRGAKPAAPVWLLLTLRRRRDVLHRPDGAQGRPQRPDARQAGGGHPRRARRRPADRAPGSRSCARSVLKLLVANIILIGWLIDSLWPLGERENRALHDLIVHTHVVTTSPRGSRRRRRPRAAAGRASAAGAADRPPRRRRAPHPGRHRRRGAACGAAVHGGLAARSPRWWASSTRSAHARAAALRGAVRDAGGERRAAARRRSTELEQPELAMARCASSSSSSAGCRRSSSSFDGELERMVVELDTVRANLRQRRRLRRRAQPGAARRARPRAARRDERGLRGHGRRLRLEPPRSGSRSVPGVGVDEDVVAWRRHLHRHPEVSFSEHETSAWVAETLEGFGLARRAADRDERRWRACSGSARADGRAAGGHRRAADPGGERRRVRVRAARARCTRAGTTGTPRCCSARPSQLVARDLPAGEVRFIFQHAEELAPGGARELVAAGVMEGVDFIYGCHLWTPLAYGKVAAVPGDVHGRGGLLHAHDHRARRARGAPPHRRRHDRRAAELVGSLQHIVSRRIDPLEPAVVTDRQPARRRRPERDPGRGRADRHDALVRSRRARADPEADRRDRPRRLRGARRRSRARLPVRLPAGRQRRARDASWCARRSARTSWSSIDPIMGGDDFSAFLAEAPGCYAFIGAGGEYPHHHPRFVIDERALAIGHAAARRRRPARLATKEHGVTRVSSRASATRCSRICGAGWTPPAGPTTAARGPEHGLGLAAARELASYWRDGYDWRAAEAVAQRLRAARSSTACTSSPTGDGPPLLLLHGWPIERVGVPRGSCRCCATTRG